MVGQKNMKLQRFLVVALTSALFYAGPARAQPRYTVTSFPTSIYNIAAINIFGEATGEMRDPSKLPSGSTCHLLGTPLSI
jgi:hypothetical protein